MNLKKQFLLSLATATLFFGGCGVATDAADKNITFPDMNEMPEMNNTMLEGEHEAPHFSYDAETGPAYWGHLSEDWATCNNGLTQTDVQAGHNHQSPVDFVTTGSIATAQNFTVNYDNNLTFDIINNGHTIQLNEITPDTNNTLTINGVVYQMLQFHFHATSEHLEDNKSSAMEMHFVNKAADGSLAVLGMFIDANDTAANAELSKVFEHELPAPLAMGHHAATRATNSEEAPAPIHVNLNLNNILPATTTTVYNYSGSLTTPPCTEGVAWNVYTTHTALKADDIAKYTAHYNHNHRPVTGQFK